MPLLRGIIFMLLFCSSFHVKAEYFVIKDYKVDIDIFGSKGYFEVNETIQVVFSEPRHGIRRRIPYRYLIDGKEVETKIYDIEVVGFKFSTSSENNDIIIKIGDKNTYVSDKQVYQIRYKVKKAFLFSEQHTEFYWNIIGHKWATEIEKISYQVKLDEALPMNTEDYYIYTGPEGAKGKDATVRYYVNRFEGASIKPFGPNEGLSLAIKLPFAYIKRPGAFEVFWEKYGLGSIGGLLLILVSGIFYRIWARYGKDYPIVKMVQYVPPKDLNPAEVGVIIDEKADNIDILALLPYWAQNGIITIKKIPKSWGKDDHELTKIADLNIDAGPYEKIVFDGLFAYNNSVLVSDLENKFYEHLQSAKISLKTHLNHMGIYYPVSIKLQIFTGVAAFLIGLIAIIVAIIFKSILFGALLGLGSIIGFIFANYMLKKNEKGVHLYQQIIGFKMFVKAAEKDKIEWLLKEDPNYFEKTLPYAMIFGYAKVWSKKFDGLLTEPPKWYIGPGGFYPGHAFVPSEFGSSFDNSIHEIQSVFNSMPASSGSGGSFSGGGSSGGGFGGGGGDSW